MTGAHKRDADENEGVDILNPAYWHDEDFTEDVVRDVFRSATTEEMALLDERFRFMKDASEVLCKVR